MIGMDNEDEELIRNHKRLAACVKEPIRMHTDAVVENKPQQLRDARLLRLDEDVGLLTPNAIAVIDGLVSCFQKQGFLKEGKAEDIIWGFEVSGFDPTRVVYGLIDLKRAGYIRFEDDDGNAMDEHSDNLKSAWVRYSAAFRNLPGVPQT